MRYRAPLNSNVRQLLKKLDMANYLIKEQNETHLLLREKQKSRFGFGIAFLLLGGAICTLAFSQISAASSIGPIMGLLLGVLCGIAGLLSIIRRGWIRIDDRQRVFEYLGGSRKCCISARRIDFQSVEKILINTSISGAHKSYSLILKLEGSPEERLDNTNDANYANSLAQEIAERIGCELDGHAA